MNIKLLFTFLIGIAALQLCQAHALWIETSAEGKINQKHTVKVFYGEYAQQQIEPIDEWYSDVKDFDLYLISPNGEKTKLEKKAKGDHFISEFLPTTNGTYAISVIHAAKEAYQSMRFEFSSLALVNIGENRTLPKELPFHIETASHSRILNSTMELQVFHENKALPETEVAVMGPDGWSKSLKTDANGKIYFKPFIRGKYIIEASQIIDKVENWSGQNIEKTWQGTTYTIIII